MKSTNGKKQDRRHLLKEDRIVLQGMIQKEWSQKMMADYLHVSVSTVSKELKRNHIVKPGSKGECEKRPKMPYGLCNLCGDRNACNCTKHYYDCTKAQQMADERLVETRAGMHLTTKEVNLISEKISPCIKAGMSPYVALLANPEIEVSESTVRRMIDHGMLEVNRMSLRNARKRRRKADAKRYRTNVRVNNPARLVGRMAQNLRSRLSGEDLSVVEIDSVIGKKTDKTALLTVMFVKAGLQIGFLYERKKEADNVLAIMKELIRSFGEDAKTVFQAILTDNGTEFASIHLLEKEFPWTAVYFADPYKSCDKAHCERNHEFIRFFVHKGESLDSLTQEKVNLMFDHINSYPRKILKEKSPLELFEETFGSQATTKLGLHRIGLKDIILKPEILA